MITKCCCPTDNFVKGNSTTTKLAKENTSNFSFFFLLVLEIRDDVYNVNGGVPSCRASKILKESKLTENMRIASIL